MQRAFQKNFKSVSIKFLGNFKGVSRKFQGYSSNIKGPFKYFYGDSEVYVISTAFVLGKFLECFQGVS